MPSSVTFLDFETDLSAPGYMIPFPAIATTYAPTDGARLWLTHQLPELLERLLSDDSTAIGGHNLATFDLPVIAEHLPWLRPLLWSKIERGQIVDTMVAQRQIQINRGAKGPLNLGDCARSVGLPFVDKKDDAIKAIRMGFGRHIGATEIPAEDAEYALGDVQVLPEMFERQYQTGLVSMSDMAQLVEQQFDLALVAARGIRCDGPRVERLAELVAEKIRDLEVLARAQGFLHGKPKKDGTSARNMRAIQAAIGRAYDAEAWPAYEAARASKATVEELQRVAGAIPLTEKGGVCTDRLTLEDAPSRALQDLSEWSQMLSIRNKDLPIFRGAVRLPAHTRFNIADTSRSTSGGEDAFNAQNFGKLAGVRECIMARPGTALVASDLKMGELVGLAQIIVERLGLRTMADKLNTGVDMHAEIGADVLGLPELPDGSPDWREVKRRMKAGDHEAEEARDSGKPANFGMNGGMTKAETFQHYARKSYNQHLTLERSKQVMASWQRRAVDQQAYLAAIKATGRRIPDPTSQWGYRTVYDCPLPRFENLVRRGLSRTEASNNPFQRMCMKMAARGLHLIQREQYLPTGRMLGSHAMMFTHDEVVSEVPLELVEEHAALHEELMCQASREVCPDVFTGADTRAMTHLSKGAKATRSASGGLGVTPVHMPDSLSKQGKAQEKAQ
jgi:hypothetical protein